MIGSRAFLIGLLEALSRRRSAVGAVVVAMMVMAGIGLTQMPLQLLPEIHYPQVRVIGDLPGQTSSVIEESINEPMEAALAGTPGVVRMESRSGDGRAYIDLFFEPDHDLDRAVRDVTQASQRARDQIPDDFPEPRIFPVATTEEPVLQYAFGSSTLSAPEIRQRLRSSLLPRLRSISGVDAVYMGREEISELVIDIDPERQNELDVSLDEVEQTLIKATDPPPSSAMRTSTFDGIGVLGVDGWEVAHLTSHPLFFDGGQQSVALDAIAGVHRAPSEQSLRTRLDGQSAVLVTIHRSPRAHSLQVADNAHEVVDEVAAAEAFGDIDATLLYDDSVVTSSAVRSVAVAVIGGAFLAMLLLAFTLRRRRYVPLVAVVVTASLSGAILVLLAMGHSLNLLTLAGLLLSVGLSLDYAIIYFDRLDRLYSRPNPPDSPHIQAMVEVAGPLLGALCTTLAAVLPFLLVQGLVALLFQPLIWTVVICAVFSFVFAIIILPTFVSHDIDTSSEPAVEAPSSRWRRFHNPLIALTLVTVLGATIFWGGKELPFEVLPVVDDGFVDVRITHPAGIPADEMDRLTRDVESELQSVDGTQAVFTTVGGYFRDGQPSFRPGTANFMIRVDTDGGQRPSEQWANDARDAIDTLELTELSTSVTLPRIRGVQTRLSDADLIVVLTREDDDILELTEVETQVVELLSNVDGLEDVERMRSGVSPRWIAEPDYAALRAYGIDPADVENTAEYVLEGRVLRQRMDGGEPLALRVRYDRRDAGGPQHLRSFRLPSESGPQVRLGDVVDFELIEEPTHIERREGQRVVRVAGQFDPAGPGATTVAEEVERSLSTTDLGGQISWWTEGEMDALDETRQTFALAIALALLMVLTLLMIQYSSFSFATAAFLTIPLSGAGAITLLLALHRPLDAMVLAGLLIAVGIVANNVILVLSETKARIERQELELREALRYAASDRLRPILLTVASTVLGMSPLLWGGAEVFGLLQPLAIALTGALLISIPLAVIVLPGVLVGFDSVGKALATLWPHDRSVGD